MDDFINDKNTVKNLGFHHPAYWVTKTSKIRFRMYWKDAYGQEKLDVEKNISPNPIMWKKLYLSCKIKPK